MAELPAAWQAHMAEMIRGAAPLDGSWFAGNAHLDAEQQIAVYAEQYRLRMWDSIREDVRGLAVLVGDGLEDLLFAYLADHPPSAFTLARLTDHLADWLAANGHPAPWVEMARLDRACMRSFVAGEGSVPKPGEIEIALQKGLSVRLRPYVELLRLTTSVHRVRSALQHGDAVPELEAGDFPLAVYRRDFRLEHVELDPAAFAILQAFGRGDSLEAALGDAIAVVGDPATLAPKLGGWFAWFVKTGLVQLG